MVLISRVVKTVKLAMDLIYLHVVYKRPSIHAVFILSYAHCLVFLRDVKCLGYLLGLRHPLSFDQVPALRAGVVSASRPRQAGMIIGVVPRYDPHGMVLPLPTIEQTEGRPRAASLSSENFEVSYKVFNNPWSSCFLRCPIYGLVVLYFHQDDAQYSAVFLTELTQN